MKLIKKRLILLIVALSVILSLLSGIVLSSKTNTLSKLKREQSMMEMFNNYFREDNLSNNIYETKIKSKNQYEFSNNFRDHPRFKSKNENNNDNNEQFYHSSDVEKNSNLDYENTSEYFSQNNRNAFHFKESESENLSESERSEFENLAQNYETFRLMVANSNSTKISTKKNLHNSKANNNTNSSSTNKLLKKIKKKAKRTNDIIIEGWYMISSNVFHSKEKFPAIKVDKNLWIKISTDQNNFRINHAFSLFKGAEKPPSQKYFWFRLSGLNLYYSVSKCDINLLGVISINQIESVSSNNGKKDSKEFTCFHLTDKNGEVYKICGDKSDKTKLLYCQISSLLNKREKICFPPGRKHREKCKRVIQPLIIIPKPSRKCNENWTYERKGDDWECDCSEGKEQSPIDLPKSEDAIDSPVTPLFRYFKVNSKAEESTVDGILTEGHNIKIRVESNALRILHPNMGRIITVDGSVYKAEEIVIHTPSEHTIDGRKFDAEMQVIHYGQTKGDISKQIILSFLFESVPGEYNKFFDNIDSFNLPNEISKERSLCNDIFIPNVFYSADDSDEQVTIKKFSFYTYQGSLTFPPCTENTIIYVASKPLPLSTTTIKLLQEAIRVPEFKVNEVKFSSKIPENDRNIKPRNGRPVFYFNHEKYCGPDPPKNKKEIGHFEKIKIRKENIVYVADNKPSGFPESFVISKDEAYGEDIIKKIDNMFK